MRIVAPEGIIAMSKIPSPDFSMDFPARLITTELEFDDLVLPADARDEVAHIAAWMEHSKHLPAWGLDRHISHGYRALFIGAPGTGKTLTAVLLGKRMGRDVYRIDLSMMLSKWIGETEKNLANLFDVAAKNGWILFFDEADALFGKRSEVSGSNDRYANQQVSYLLQRIEGFSGLVILAANPRSAIDDAFVRRFQSLVPFYEPDAQARLRMWKRVLRDQGRLDNDIDLARLAEAYELNGAGIANVAARAAISAMRDGRKGMSSDDIETAIRHELRKTAG